MSPEVIAIRYPTLNLEQVYATINFYLHNQEEVNQYLKRWRNYADEAWQQQLHNPSPAVKRICEMKNQRHRYSEEMVG